MPHTDGWTVVKQIPSSNGKFLHSVEEDAEGHLKCSCQGFRIQKKGYCKHTACYKLERDKIA